MRRRRENDDDEIEVSGRSAPPTVPEPNYPVWDGQTTPTPEWCIEVWIDGSLWSGVLWHRSGMPPQRRQRGAVRYEHSKNDAVQKLVATYNAILATEASRTFYVLGTDDNGG